MHPPWELGTTRRRCQNESRSLIGSRTLRARRGLLRCRSASSVTAKCVILRRFCRQKQPKGRKIRHFAPILTPSKRATNRKRLPFFCFRPVGCARPSGFCGSARLSAASPVRRWAAASPRAAVPPVSPPALFLWEMEEPQKEGKMNGNRSAV